MAPLWPWHGQQEQPEPDEHGGADQAPGSGESPYRDTPADLGRASTAAAFEVSGEETQAPHEAAEQLTEVQTARVALLSHTLSAMAVDTPIAGYPRERFTNAYCASPPSPHRPVLLVRPTPSQAAAIPGRLRIIALRVNGEEIEAVNGHDFAFNSRLEVRAGERGAHRWTESGILATFLDNADSQPEMDLMVREALAPRGDRDAATRALQLGRHAFRGLTRQQSRDFLCASISALRDQDPDNEQIGTVVTSMNNTVQSLTRPNVADERSRNENDRHLGQSLWAALVDHDLVETQVFANNPSLAIPEIAVELAARSAHENLFPDLPNERRMGEASDYLRRILDHLAEQPERNGRNIAAITRALYGAKPRQRLPLQDVVELANGITMRVNGLLADTPEQQRELLTLSGQPSDLTQCGEAIFRLLEITGNDAEATEANRAYAEIFDAMMRPLYERFATARTVTIADICARYPDTTEDLVLAEDLRGTASREGWSAATAQYHAVRETLSTRGRRQLRSNPPGGGIIS